MLRQDNKRPIILMATIIGLISIAIFYRGLYTRPERLHDTNSQAQSTTQSNQPVVVVTTPDPLEEAVILPTQTIEITFNYPLENVPEFKNKMDPKFGYKVELSFDKKTVKIIPLKPYSPGVEYTFFILPDTKFESPTGKKLLKNEIIYHFKTVTYKGV